MAMDSILLDGRHASPLPAQFRQLPIARSEDVVALLAIIIASLLYASKGVLWDRPDPHYHKLFEKPQARTSAINAVQRSDNLAKRLESEESSIAVLWASQSGTTERFAGRLAKDLRRNFSVKALTLDVSEINPASLEEISQSSLVIFMASTFGEGDPSDNLHQMWAWLRADSKHSLLNVRFLAFGLGNSNYKYYNHVIDVVAQELQRHGANMLMEVGKADDAAGETEEHFLEWKQKVLSFFQDTLGYQREAARYEPSLSITDDASVNITDLWVGQPPATKPSSPKSKYFPLRILRSQQLLSGSADRSCLHIEVDISQNSNMKYKTGDHLAVWSSNPIQEVQTLLRALGLEEQRANPIHLKSLDSSTVSIPSPTTLEAAFSSYLEICAPTPRESIDAFVSYAPTAAAAEFLRKISHDKDSHAAYYKSNYLNLGRLLTAACPEPGAWNSVPLFLIFETLPPMQPRFYSISSSSVVSPRQISITVAGSVTTTADAPDRVLGLATNYLLSANGTPHPQGLQYAPTLPTGQIYAAIRKSTFKLPISSSAPIIMVGAGTGVAPFRAFVQERARLKIMGREVGHTRLFFGCRNAYQDQLYAQDFASWSETLRGCFAMTTAFSRPERTEEKGYVQDCIIEDAEAVRKLLLEENAYFYICGSAAMARDVSAAVSKILRVGEGWSEDEVKEFADRQKRQRRWLQDVWG